MHLRIYLWLSCVVLAGYVRATEVAVTEKPTEESIILNDESRGYEVDGTEEGSGLDPDESSGSGWGAGGPGPDDEDSRTGSGDHPIDPIGPPDDEDYSPVTRKTEETGRAFVDTVTPKPEESDFIDSDEQENPNTEENSKETSVDPFLPLDTQHINELIPISETRPREGTPVEGRGAGEEQSPRPDQTEIIVSGDDLVPQVEQEPSGTNVHSETTLHDKVLIMNAKPEDRAASFFAQPGILAAVIGGAVVGLLCAILVVMFIVYRMRKKDEGSYALDEPKRSPAAASYGKGHNNREFYA